MEHTEVKLMTDREQVPQGGQSIILVAVALVALVIFVAIAVDTSAGYYSRRTAQNGADAGALAGAQELGAQLSEIAPSSDAVIQATINEFAEANDIEDTDGAQGDTANKNVEGCYLAANEKCIAPVGGGAVPKQAVGLLVTTHITAPTYFGGIVGLDGLPLQAEAAVLFDVACTGEACMLPIAIHTMDDPLVEPIFNPGDCYNLYDGSGSGNFGWLNWSLQSPKDGEYTYSCLDPFLYSLGYTEGLTLPGDCSVDCLDINMDPNYCDRVDGDTIAVGDYVGGTTGVKTGDKVLGRLQEYIGPPPIPAKIVVYDDVKGKGGCATLTNNNGLRYHVAGFACFIITGYRLSTGNGMVKCDLDQNQVLQCQYSDESNLLYPPNSCSDYPGECYVEDNKGDLVPCDWETGEFNRITGYSVSCLGGTAGKCKAVGNLLAPHLTK
jgi:hypothetical protein